MRDRVLDLDGDDLRPDRVLARVARRIDTTERTPGLHRHDATGDHEIGRGRHRREVGEAVAGVGRDGHDGFR